VGLLAHAVEHYDDDDGPHENMTTAAAAASGAVDPHEVKAITLGFKKTGTETTKAIYKRLLGGKSACERPSRTRRVEAVIREGGDREDAVRAVLAVVSTAQCFEDHYWCASVEPFYADVYATYPRAKFVLTRRRDDAWWASMDRWIRCVHRTAAYVGLINELLGAERYEEAAYREAYNRRNDAVIAFFEARDPSRLLVVDWDADDTDEQQPIAWSAFCGLLEIPAAACPPDTEPLPHTNAYAHRSGAERCLEWNVTSQTFVGGGDDERGSGE